MKLIEDIIIMRADDLRRELIDREKYIKSVNILLSNGYEIYSIQTTCETPQFTLTHSHSFITLIKYKI